MYFQKVGIYLMELWIKISLDLDRAFNAGSTTPPIMVCFFFFCLTIFVQDTILLQLYCVSNRSIILKTCLAIIKHYKWLIIYEKKTIFSGIGITKKEKNRKLYLGGKWWGRQFYDVLPTNDSWKTCIGFVIFSELFGYWSQI